LKRKLPNIVLASSSPYRRELLSRLRIPFEVVAPEVDEAPIPEEPPALTARRLAELKARAVAGRSPKALIIGCDQLAELNGSPLGKPLTHERAKRQLTLMSGREVIFHTAVCLLNNRTGMLREQTVPCTVSFRRLRATQIESYLQRERPYDCAGSAKIEGLGIALVEAMRGEDPHALIGLPLIALTHMLEQEGIAVL
jgi:7-methyl-GTP pyrophosphatase